MIKTTASLLHCPQHSNVLQTQLTSSPFTMSPTVKCFSLGEPFIKKNVLSTRNKKESYVKWQTRKTACLTISNCIGTEVGEHVAFKLHDSLSECFPCVLEFRTEVAATTAVIKILPHHLALEDRLTFTGLSPAILF